MRPFAVALSLFVSQTARAYDALELHNDIRSNERPTWAAPDPLAPHLADSTATGMAVYSVPIEVPPALLAPQLALVYSSTTQVSREVAFGWTLDGILEIERPTEPAFDAGSSAHGDGEYLISGDGFSGILQPYGSAHRLRSAIPNLKVTASYVSGMDEWVVQSSTGETWVLASIEPAPTSERETGRWRVVQKTDRFDNEITYTYDGLGRILDITYGQNLTTLDGAMAQVVFDYENPWTTRYDGRKGYLDRRRPELFQIRIYVDPIFSPLHVYTYEIERDVDTEFGASRITGIQRIGHDPVYGGDDAAAPATHFTYNDDGMPEEDYSVYVDIEFTSDLTESDVCHPAYRIESKTDKNETCVQSGFFDLNGDGFKEYVRRHGGNWLVHDHLVDEFGESYWSDDIRYLEQSHLHEIDDWGHCLSVEKSWGHPGRTKLGEAVDEFFGGITPWDDWGILAANAQLAGLYDVDGDGYLDFVEASGVEHEAGDGTFFISFGWADGFEDEIEVDVPGGTTKAITVSFMDQWYGDSSFPTLQLMIDVDGDGWLDIIRDEFLRGGSEELIQVAYHTRDRETGWEPFVDYADFSGFSMGAPLGFSHNDGDFGMVGNRLVDMNADGLLDIVQVDDCSEKPLDDWYEHPFAQQCDWFVWFGLGTNGWSGAWSWPAPSNVIDATYRSSIGSETYGTLLDINGDGLPDWVDFLSNHWWPNSGSGFAELDHGQLLPDYLTEFPLYPWPMWEVTELSGKGQEAFQMSTLDDLNGDGILDRVGWVGTRTEVGFGTYNEPNILTLGSGTYNEPNILKYVETDTGRASEFWYVPSNITERATEPSWWQELHTSFPIQSAVVTTDFVTDLTAESTFTFAKGRMDAGVFLGFEERTVHIIEEDFAEEVLYEESYKLEAGLAPRLTGRATYTDWCRPFAPALAAGGCVGLQKRQGVGHDYYESDSDPAFVHTTTIATRGDEHGLTDSDYAIRRLKYDYDANGFYESITFDHPHRDSPDKVEETFLFEPVTTDPGEKVIRLKAHWTHGFDPANPTADPFEQGYETYGWDPQGGIDWVTIEGRYEGIAEGLTTDYEVGTRGEIEKITDLSTGEYRIFTYAFGNAVKASEDQSGLRLFEFEVDERGRTYSKSDYYNEVKYLYMLDPLDRLESSKMEYAGEVHPLEEYEYQWSYRPTWTRHSRCISPSTTCDDSDDQYTSFDGAGNRSQHLVESPTGTGWAYSEFTTDLFGREVTAFDGLWVSEATTMLGLDGRTGDVTSAWYYDPLGELREVDSDTHATRPGTRTVRRGAGLTRVEKDEEGYQRRITFNDRGLPQQVELGKGGTFTVMGSYGYDALDRLTQAVGPTVDSSETVTQWTYDLAGRLRRVSAPDIGTRDYAYVGNLLVSQDDSAGGWADWGDFDLLGRPWSLVVSDPASSTGESTYGWEYDHDWVGAVSFASDPLGETWLVRGDRGEIIERERLDAGGKSLVTFNYTSDLLDRPTQWTTTTKTSRTFDLTWTQGVPTRLEVGGTGLATLTYDVRGRLKQWDATGAPLPRYQATFSAAKSMPDKVQLLGTAGAIKRKRSYVWESNDLLTSVTDGTTAPLATTTFFYDDFKRLTRASGGLWWTEDFEWDDAGNPIEVHRSDGTVWTYSEAAPAVSGNRLHSRTSGSTTEHLLYDGAGQIIRVGQLILVGSTTGATHYEYDGLGRLRRTWGEGAGYPTTCTGAFASECTKLVLDWTADGEIIRRSEGPPTASSTPQTLIIGDWSRNRSGVETQEFGVPGMSIGSYKGATRSWNFQEADGHVSATMNDAGALTSTRELSAFGHVRASTGSTSSRRFGQHGLWFDQDSKLVSAGARHFAPLDGMFLQPDPMMLKGPSAAWVLDPGLMNPYRYGRNAPTSFIDRDGEMAVAAVAYGAYEVAATASDVKATYDSWQTVRQDPSAFNIGCAVLQTGLTGASLHPLIPSGEATAVKLVLTTGVAAAVLQKASSAAKAVSRAANAVPGRTVLGRYPAYIEKAKALAANRFNVPEQVWNAMSDGERWGANQKFLDRMIARGDEIMLASPISEALPGTWYARELEYLATKGFVPSADGTKLVKAVK